MDALSTPPSHLTCNVRSQSIPDARPQRSITCSSSTAIPIRVPLGGLKAPSIGADVLQCPGMAPPQQQQQHQGDWNSRMLFNRGSDMVKSVDKDTLWDAVEAAGDKPVVLDLYSKWCGPCRRIYPKLVKLSDKYTDVVFLKLDCGAENKTAFSKLGIGILPTFKIFKNSSLVSEVRGAKYEELVSKIEKARATCLGVEKESKINLVELGDSLSKLVRSTY